MVRNLKIDVYVLLYVGYIMAKAKGHYVNNDLDTSQKGSKSCRVSSDLSEFWGKADPDKINVEK